MSKLSWKTLGLAVLVAGGLQMATMGGAAAATLPVPASPGVDAANQVVQVKHKYGHHRFWRHRYRYRRPGYGYRYRGYWYRRPWWTFTVPVPGPVYGGNRHVRWCLNRYRSYNPRTDTFMGYDGYRHRCRSPFRP